VIDAPAQQGETSNQAGQGGQTGQQTGEQGGEQGGTGAQIGSDAILAGLGTDLGSAARKLSRAKQSALVRARSSSISVNALTAGTFAVAFKGAAGRANASRSVTIAKGRVVATGAGRYALKLKLTRAGRSVLRKGKRVSGKLTMSFTRPDGSKLSRSRTLTLRRR
jgi:hypothetical protein